MGKSIFQTYQGKDGLSPGDSLFFRHPPEEAGHHRIFEGSELGEQMMELEDEPDLFVSEEGQFLFVQGEDIPLFIENFSGGRSIKGS